MQKVEWGGGGGRGETGRRGRKEKRTTFAARQNRLISGLLKVFKQSKLND